MSGPDPVPAGTIAACCADRANRVVAPGDPAHPERTHAKCATCGRSHYSVNYAMALRMGLIRMPEKQ